MCISLCQVSLLLVLLLPLNFFAIFSKEDNSFGVNQLYTDRLFHCYVSDKSISFCHFKGVRFYFIASSLFLMENPVSKQCRP